MSHTLTSIEETFHYEIIFNKICGGFMFSSGNSARNWWSSAAYGVAVIALSRVFNIKYTYTVVQNFNEPLNRGSAQQNFKLFWTAYYLVANATVVVNFLTGIKYHDLVQVILRKRFDKRFLSSNSASSSSSNSENAYVNSPAVRMMSVPHELAEKEQQAKLTTTTTTSQVKLGARAHVRTVRYLFITYLALTTLSYCLNRRASYCLKTASRSALSSDCALSFLSSLNSISQAMSRGINKDIWRVILKTIRGATIDVAFLCIDFVQAALTLSQTYGQSSLVLMVTATLTDMISFSRTYEGLVYVEQDLDSIEVAESARLNPRRKPALTTDVLVQAREVLIVLRCSMSITYLMILIFNLSQLIGVFLMFNEAVANGKFDALILICVDYVLVTFSMYLSRYGYHWLHNEVRKLKRVVDERHLLRNNKQEDSKISYAERVTACRLAEDIEALWPTDWYKPDLKSYLKQNILVVALVATLQQLVDASSRIEYNKQN